MKLIILCFVLFDLSLSQYVLGRGFYIGGNVAYSFTNVFETDINTDNTIRYSGNGSAFGLELLYKLNRRNMILAEFGQRKIKIQHESTLLADSASVATSSIKQKMQFNTFQIQFLKKFEQNPLFIGGGAGGRFPSNQKGSDYIQNLLDQSYGIGTIGLEFADNQFSVVTYLSYAFPVSKLKKNDQTSSQLGELFVGLKLWVKLF